ncbi:MAG: DNA polymerase I [Phycisphaerae bacterium]
MGPMLGGPVLDVDEVREAIGPVLADESIEKIGQNIKYDILVLRHAGFELRGPLMDTMVAAHVMDSTRRSLKMDSLARDLLNHECIPIDQLIGTGKNQLSMNEVPVDVVAKYAAEDADVTFRLAEVLRSQLQQAGMDELFADLEMPLLPVLADMEYEGITVDPERLKEMEVELSRRSDELRDRIIDLAGRPFNVDSPKQLATVMFDELGMRVIKKTKSGPSTDSFVLSELAIEHELPALVLDYRKLTKLLGTYLKALGECIHPETHRVHTSFNQAGTATGRLSSSDPNLQNIPVRTEEGRRIRSAFVAKPGCVLLSADYSQVELRMLAHFCQDPTMVAAFEAGQDIHRTVAAEVFGVPVGEVTGEQRSRAKTVNFGIVYGQTEWGLAATLRISRTDAREFITAYKARFPKIDEYLRQIVQVAKQRGYVETIFGRRRFISGLNARGPARSAAERLAINSTVQGSAADLIKQAMVNISGRIKSENRPTRMLLQIHDELVCEVPEDAVETEKQFIVNEMAGAIDLRVPLKVDVGVGTNWMDAK